MLLMMGGSSGAQAVNKGLRDALLRFMALSPREKARMQEAIRTLTRTKYTWETSARELFSIYESLSAPASP